MKCRDRDRHTYRETDGSTEFARDGLLLLLRGLPPGI